MQKAKVLLLWFSAVISLGLLFLISSQPQKLTINLTAFILGILLEGGYFIWLFVRRQFSLPDGRLGIPVLFFLGAILLSWFASPSLLGGVERIGWILTYIIWFYILIHCQQNPNFARVIRYALIFLSGVLLIQLVLETYLWYQNWWYLIGSKLIMPPYAYRFKGLFGSNYSMAFLNLCAPIALASFIKARSFSTRIAYAFWLVLFIFCVPFSSSRGGWLGTGAWVSTFSLLLVLEEQRWSKIIKFIKHNLILVVIGFLVLAPLLSFSAIQFYKTFAGSHPTHSSGLSLNREEIWLGAIALWKDSPLFGVGPGLVSSEYLNVTSTFPSGWWPKNAHSIPIQILVEFGALGLIAFLILLLFMGRELVKSYKASEASSRIWHIASSAALAGILAHGFFDDFTWLPILIVVTLFHITFSFSTIRVEPHTRSIPIYALWVPAMFAACIAAYSIWAYKPLYDSLSVANENWHKASLLAEESVRRNPSSPFYKFQSGIAWAMDWSRNNDMNSLVRSITQFNEVVQAEPANTVAWANLAVLEWHSGERSKALDFIQKAILLSPEEPSFYLNYGWFLEQSGMGELAIQQYQKALDLSPWSYDHPFWDGSPTRRLAVSGMPPVEVELPHWKQALDDLQNIEISDYRKELALSEVNREPDSARLTSGLAIGLSDKKPPTERSLETLLWSVQARHGYFYGNGYLYNSAYNKSGFVTMVVPGYLQVSENQFQFSALERLYEIQIMEGNCEGALLTKEVLQREFYAGEIVQADFLSDFQCTSFADQ